jgi:PPOX class probable F420-dependent enzyme
LIELPPEVRRLLDGPNNAHVATLLPDGGPHSVPAWVGIEGDMIVFQTSPDSRKARNIERDPRVAISVTDRNNLFAMAQVRGRVVKRLEGDQAMAVVDRLSLKYTNQPYPLRTGRVAFLVEPEEASAHSYG